MSGPSEILSNPSIVIPSVVILTSMAILINIATSIDNLPCVTHWSGCFTCVFSFLFFSTAAAAKSLQSYPTLCDPIDGSPPGSPSLGFSRQEHWSGLPFSSPFFFFHYNLTKKVLLGFWVYIRRNRGSCSSMARPRDYHTTWSKSGR